MEEALRSLRQQRVRMLLINLVYFLALLGLGVWIFLRDGAGAAGFLLAAVCAAAYLVLVRPVRQRYLTSLRREILCRGVCRQLTDVRYEPRGGVPADRVQAAFPFGSAEAFMSREHLTGRMGTLEAELADVTFPFVEGKRNAMFSGVFLQLTWPGSAFAPLSVDAGSREGLDLPRAQLELIEQLDAFVPGSLYLRAGGETLTALLRGRFLGFRINPLMTVHKQTLEDNPLPELDQAIRLTQLMRLGRRT